MNTIDDVLTGRAKWCVITGDALDVLRTIPAGSVGGCIFDPPFGYAYESNHTCDTTTAGWMNAQIENDDDLRVRDAVLAWAGQKPWASFGSWKCAAPANTRGVLVWDKGPASGMGDLSFPWKGSFELIYVGGDGWEGHRDEGIIRDCWIVTRASMGRVHPNEKPVSLMLRLLKKLPGDSVIVDPCCGSGPVGVACMQTGRRFIGIEIDEGYAAIARRRISEAANHLFAETK